MGSCVNRIEKFERKLVLRETVRFSIENFPEKGLGGVDSRVFRE